MHSITKRLKVLKFAGIVTALLVGGAAQAAGTQAHRHGVWIVRMAEAPAVAYTGDIAGYKATRPGKYQKIDPTAPDVVRYASYLDARHDAALNAVGGRKLYDYRYTFSGFAAELTAEQAAKLLTLPGVLSVDQDEQRDVDTSSTPAFLGLSGSTGFWNTTGATGEGVIIGVIDTGIWPESLSFSDRTGLNGNGTQDGKLDYQQIPGWHGKCVPGDAFPASR